MKKVAILYENYSPIVDAIKFQLEGNEVKLLNTPDYQEQYDLTVILSDFKGEYKGKGIRCHHSLLPAFNTGNPEKEAMLFGAKVTGITIYYTNPEKIISQYPIFIKNDMHYDDLKRELDYLEQVLYPVVISKILDNEVFETQNLLNKGCSGGCGGCSSCGL